jgi:hypothetical protein
MSYTQAITHRVETMEMNVNPTNPDTLPPELGSVGGLVIVPEAGDFTGLGAESTSPQHKASISLKDSHKSDPASTATLVMSSSNSIQVFVSPAPANGWKSSRPAVAPLGQMMHGFSTTGAQVDDVIVVATVVAYVDVEVRAGITSEGQQYATSMSYNPHASDSDSNRLAPSMRSLHVALVTEFSAYSGT